MKNYFKKYIPMIISILFFFIYAGLISIVFIDMNNTIDVSNNFIVYMSIMFSIIIIFILMVEFCSLC